MSGSNGLRPPSTAQAFLTGLRVRMTECAEDLKNTLKKARDEGFLNGDDPAMNVFNSAANHLNAGQYIATTIATPLAMAEHFLFQSKATVEQKAQNAMGTASGFGE